VNKRARLLLELVYPTLVIGDKIYAVDSKRVD